jgi:two-component system, chemotaxis family, sensor kinase CheA
VSDFDERNSELRDLFFDTAHELLQALNEQALKLEAEPGNAEVIRGIRRTVHTLKGDSAACGYRELSELAHELEDALAAELGETAKSQVAEIALSAADIFAAMLEAYQKNQSIPDAEALRQRIRQLTEQPAKRTTRKKSAARQGLSAPWSEYERLAIESALRAKRTVYHVLIQIDPNCVMPVAARQLLQNAMQEMGEVVAIHPEAGGGKLGKMVEAALASAKAADEIAVRCRIPTIASTVKVEAIRAAKTRKRKAAVAEAPPQPAPAEVVESAVSNSAPETAQTEPVSAATLVPSTDAILRVDAERIDDVMNLVGELIIGKSMLHQTLNDFGRRFPKDGLRNKFSDAMAFQSRVLNELQRAVMKIRMVPVEQLFRRFPRIVRDVARQCGKNVELVLSGQNTDLDKSILDGIAEPLTHMVRNAVSHGIESEEERVRAGKPSKGMIMLDAYHHANQVIIEVRDDGRGISAEKIRDKAIAMKLTTPELAAKMSEAEIIDFIFQSGFSTAVEVTEISGRGVGMDVVHSVLQRMKGTVTVETEPGRGATFRLKLPLTLAIIKALMFRVEQRLYAIPLNSVAEIARSNEAEVHRIDNHEVLQLRNHALPLIRLGHIPPDSADRRAQKFFLLVIQVGERKFGLVVNELVGEEELVIKALDDQVVATELVSGASILGDGRVVLILNLPAIVERVSRLRPEKAGAVLSGLLFTHGEIAVRNTGWKDATEVEA